MIAFEAGSFWQLLWLIFISFLFISFLMVLFSIFADLYSDPNESGWAKAFWTIGLLALPIIGSLVYLIFRGEGMAARANRQAADSQQEVNAYIRSVAGGPATELQKASELHDSGKLSDAEYAKMKAQILGS